MADILGCKIKDRIEEFLTAPEFLDISSNRAILEKINSDYLRKADGLRAKLGDAFSDLDTFHAFLFDSEREKTDRTRTVLVAVMAYFLNPFDFVPDGIPLVGLVDDRLVIALAAKICGKEIEGYTRD